MSQHELRRRLAATVEQHPSRLTRDGNATLERVLDGAAVRLAAEPDRADEAERNLARFLGRAAELSGAAEGVEVLTVDRESIDADALEAALRDLCPFFPIC